jgi:Tfp pilus assembly protein PilE
MKSDERGLTIVELIMATAVTGLIVSFLGTSIHQMFTVTEYGNDRLTAMHELQNVAHWFNLDGQRAIAANANSELQLTISKTSSIIYSLVGTELRRTAGGAQMTLAQNITHATFSIEDRVITMHLISSPEGQDNVSENGTYKVYLRPAEEAE